MADNTVEGNTPDDQDSGISLTGKIVAGVLLVFFTVMPVYIIIAYWPDKVPKDRTDTGSLYINECFHVRLAGITDSICGAEALQAVNGDTLKIDEKALQEGVPDTSARDSARLSGKNTIEGTGKQPVLKQRCYKVNELIHINTLILLLVAAAGFAGNMISNANSFTVFIGIKKFSQSWLLWYFVKPFTAATLAIGTYFVFNSDTGNINLYGIMTLALLTGLFTDISLKKLEDIFGTSYNRKDMPEKPAYKFNAVTPESLSRNDMNTILIKGENLDKGKLTIKVNDDTITADKIAVTPKTITIQYKIGQAQALRTECKLQVLDEQNKELFAKVFGIV